MLPRVWRASVGWSHDQVPTDEQLDKLVQALPGYGTVQHVSDGESGALTAGMTVEEPTLRAATDSALKAARTAHTAAFAVAGDPIEVRVLTDDAWTQELTNPRPLDLVGVYEIGEILGVTQQRVSQLATHPAFPRPVAEPRAGRMYTRSSVEAFASSDWRRRGGRPKKAVAPS